MLQVSADILESFSDASLMIKNGRVSYANGAARKMLGSDCVGKTPEAVLGADLAAIQAPSFIGDFPVNGKRSIVRVSSADGVKAVFLSRIEDNENLINDSFIFSLRNCIMSISVALSLLRQRTEEEPGLKSSLAVISHECFRINRVLSNIGIIRGVSDDAPVFNPVYMDLSCFMEEILDSIRLLWEAPVIRLNVPKNIYIYADPGLVQCLVLNLLSNCFIHAEGCSRISISLTPYKDRVMMSVDDDGCGIPSEELHSVFDRYSHEFDLSDMGRGAGLGLTAARMIAALHGGTLLLESRENSGTAVRVSLSRNPYGKSCVNQPVFKYVQNMNELLTGLAGSLPTECFTDRYLE